MGGRGPASRTCPWRKWNLTGHFHRVTAKVEGGKEGTARWGHSIGSFVLAFSLWPSHSNVSPPRTGVQCGVLGPCSALVLDVLLVLNKCLWRTTFTRPSVLSPLQERKGVAHTNVTHIVSTEKT